MSTADLTYVCDDRRHLVCIPYSVDNLHRMAADLGLGRHWYHAGRSPHYDLPVRREAEIMSRCKVVSSRAILAIVRGHTDAPGYLL